MHLDKGTCFCNKFTTAYIKLHRNKWLLTMFTSDEQISPQSLACEEIL